MRNLKKVLALGLALIMAMSLMLSASAFTDDASITNVEAANLLTDLNILAGFPDGSFKPADLVTRGQMAKMVYVALRGGVDDKALLFSNANVPLSDIGSHWAKGYIKFAYANNIIGGFTDGTFRPEASVTGYQAAKMLLTALGYSTAIEGYSGTGWDYNVAIDALNAGLLDGGLSAMDLSLPLTRDSAALMFMNALNAKMVTYPSGVLSVGANSMLTVKYSLTTVTGILMATDEIGFGAKAAAGKCVIGTTTYAVDAPAALLGQEVSISVGAGSKVYGAVKATSDNYVKIAYNGGTTTYGTGYDATGAQYSDNYAALASSAPTALVGDKTVYIDNDGDKSYDIIIVANYVYSEADITVLTAGNTIAVANLFSGSKAVADVIGAASVSDGDKVLGYALKYTAGTVYTIAKAVPTTMVYSGIVSSKPKLDGTVYDAATITGYAGFGALTTGTIASGTAVNVVILNGYVVAYIPASGPAAAPTMYCGIRDTLKGTAADGWTAKVPAKVAVTLADGTEAIYDVGTIATAVGVAFDNQTQLNGLEGKIVTYSITDGKININSVASGTLVAAGVDNAAATNLLTVNSANYVVDASTVLFVWNGSDDFVVYVGRANIPAIEDDDTANVIASGTPSTAKVILATGVAAPSAPSTTKTGIVISYEILVNSSSKAYYAIKLFDGSSIVTVNTSAFATLADLNGSSGFIPEAELVNKAIIEYTLTDGVMTAADIKYQVAVDGTNITGDGYIAGYVSYYDNGLINLCLGGTAATDELYVVKSSALTVQLSGMTSTTPAAAVGAINPVMSVNDINTKAATKFNVICKVDDGQVIAVYYFADGDVTFPVS